MSHLVSDLHVHLGGAVPTAVLWEILCDQGLSTSYASFAAFHQALSATKGQIRSLDDFLNRYFHVTEDIQSAPGAILTSAYQMVAKAHRRGGVNLIEVRFNPAKRLRGGLHTMDAIILATLQGLERATLHYGVKTAAILSMGRDCSIETNQAIFEAALKGRRRGGSDMAAGIVGIDMAGPESLRKEFDEDWLLETSKIFNAARDAGLGTTYHIGETSKTGWKGLERVINRIRPQRIGHGIQMRLAPARKFDDLAAMLRSTSTCLELCPTVNVVCRSADGFQELGDFAARLHRAAVPFIAATDNPYLVHTNIVDEQRHLARRSKEISAWMEESARKATFHPMGSSV